jgi:hypothetical protein
MTVPSGAIVILHESDCPTLPPPDRDDLSAMRRNPNPYAPMEVIRQFVEDGVLVTAVIVNPADAQQTRYGMVTRSADGTLVGTYHPCDLVRREDWPSSLLTAHPTKPIVNPPASYS